jgi:L-ascorbate metabolism protein UlaG (beta-lactamase superfamily)
MKLKTQFGGKVSAADKDRYTRSTNWKNGKFENLVTTTMEFSFQEMPKLIYKQIFDKKGRNPKQPIPVEAFDKAAFLAESDEPKFIWYGHSVVLMRWMNKTILIDPMLGPNASPIAPFATKRFSENSLTLIDQFPEIDLLLMTHDHYDHLDLDSINKLKLKTKKWFVALGVGRHLEAWGIPSNTIQEFDWWDEADFEGIHFTFTPSRHFSGRGLTDRAKSLWGGWVMKSDKQNLYWSGDGGYGDHFQEIGKKLGPFDFGYMECGQYNEQWHQIHMYPEEAAQASKDAGANNVMAVHWAGFALALHHWKDPIERFTAHAAKLGLNVFHPKIGEIIHISGANHTKKWWENHE